MSRQIVITLPEWTEIKGIDNKQFAELLPCYDEMLNMIKNGTPLDEVLEKIRAEIDAHRKTIRNMADIDDWYAGKLGGHDCDIEIIDRYRTGSNETQTNEIVYDIGGHMYGAMGGDVIMDILAGKGKE